MDRIEDAVKSSNVSELSRLLRAYWRKSKKDSEANIFISLCYRRAGDLRRAVHSLKARFQPDVLYSGSQSDLRLQVQAIQLLAMLGAKSLSLKLVGRIPEDRKRSVAYSIALVYLACRDFDEALIHFRIWLSDLVIRDSENAIYCRMYIGHCLGMKGDLHEAAKILNELLDQSADPTVRLFAKKDLLASNIVSNDPDRALELASELLRQFDTVNDRSMNLGGVLENYGAALALKGRYKESAIALSESLSRLHRDGHRPGIWLGVLFWQGLVQYRESGQFPIEWARLTVYPAAYSHSYFREFAPEVSIPKAFLIGVENFSSEPSRDTHFDLEFCSKISGYGTSNRRNQLGFTVLDRCLIALTLAGPYGISEYALCDHLWAGDIAANQFQKRVAQLLKRLRRLGYSIESSLGQIKLRESRSITCAWAPATTLSGGIFFEDLEAKSISSFSRRDVEVYFDVSKSQALAVCAQWIDDEVIVREEQQGNIRYRLKERRLRYSTHQLDESQPRTI